MLSRIHEISKDGRLAQRLCRLRAGAGLTHQHKPGPPSRRSRMGVFWPDCRNRSTGDLLHRGYLAIERKPGASRERQMLATANNSRFSSWSRGRPCCARCRSLTSERIGTSVNGPRMGARLGVGDTLKLEALALTGSRAGSHRAALFVAAASASTLGGRMPDATRLFAKVEEVKGCLVRGPVAPAIEVALAHGCDHSSPRRNRLEKALGARSRRSASARTGRVVGIDILDMDRAPRALRSRRSTSSIPTRRTG